MASNSFGNFFRITTWGESHGKAIGVVIDGCPAGISISENEINEELTLRTPGKSSFTSPRKENDLVKIESGIFEGKTTGCPISLIIDNIDADSTKYDALKNIARPSHASFTYMQKYGVYDHRGAGRASARETVARVAAGAVAKIILKSSRIEMCSYLKQIGNIRAEIKDFNAKILQQKRSESTIFCPEVESSQLMQDLIAHLKKQGDSIGGIVETVVYPIPIGLGDPIYEKMEARLAYAMLSLPASKGFEIGEGFKAAEMQGSDHNDPFICVDGQLKTESNHSGGTLAGITNGMPLVFRVAFKPTSSIKLPQETVTLTGEKTLFSLPEGSRHDPCVAIRAVPVVEAMTALVLVDALLMNSIKLKYD